MHYICEHVGCFYALRAISGGALGGQTVASISIFELFR